MNLFGTDGVRNKVGNHPFTPDALPRLGRALTQWAREKYGHIPDFLIARDTRFSGSWIKASLASGILRSNSILYDAHVLPTPAVFHIMKADPRYTCGIILSASHNPAEDNGIKLIDREGKISSADEERITELMTSLEEDENFDECGLELPLPNAEELYIEKICSLFKPYFLTGLKIVIDCAHGATYRVAPAIFTALGADIIILNNHPNGHNINKNCGALHVEGLQAAVREHNALVGFAFDGDGDRVTAVNKEGIIKDGDDILALLLEHPEYKQMSAVVSTIMANKGFETYLESLGKKLIRSSVGDKYVSQALLAHDLTLGGEPSGHIILHSLIPTGDGILVGLKIIETMLLTKNYEFHTFEKYPQVLINVPITNKKPLDEPPLKNIIVQSEQLVPQGRVLVRYSGTERIVRVMVEDADKGLTQSVAQSLAQQLQKVLFTTD